MNLMLQRFRAPVSHAANHLRHVQKWGIMSPLQLKYCQQQQQVRNFGLMETLQNTATGKVNQNRENQFMKMIDLMCNSPKWTLRMWKSTMDEQLNSWLMYVPGMSKQGDVEQLKVYKDMLEKMTPQELENPQGINFVAKERISKASGKAVEDVSKMLFYFQQSQIMQEWLQIKKKKGEKIPTTEAELYRMQETDVRFRNITKATMSKKKSGRGMRMPF